MTDLFDPYEHPSSMLSFAVFKTNGEMISFGDDLVRPLGLTSARWQVMGAIQVAREPLPVASIARNMGLVRQSVQRLADELASLGLVDFAENPHHRRAKLVLLTPRGTALLDEANRRWMAVAEEIAASISPKALKQASAVLMAVREKLEAKRHDLG